MLKKIVIFWPEEILLLIMGYEYFSLIYQTLALDIMNSFPQVIYLSFAQSICNFFSLLLIIKALVIVLLFPSMVVFRTNEIQKNI